MGLIKNSILQTFVPNQDQRPFFPTRSQSNCFNVQGIQTRLMANKSPAMEKASVTWTDPGVFPQGWSQGDLNLNRYPLCT